MREASGSRRSTTSAEQVNLKDSAVQTPELSDKAAYRVLDSICQRPYAATFRLYKLYARADSFAPFAED